MERERGGRSLSIVERGVRITPALIASAAIFFAAEIRRFLE